MSELMYENLHSGIFSAVDGNLVVAFGWILPIFEP